MAGVASGKLHDLQALRALAAALVVIDHGIMRFRGADPYQPFAWYLGQLGVCIFFVISGFIMVTTTTGESGAGDAGEFFLKRLIRVVPIYWIATLIQASMAWRKTHFQSPDIGWTLSSLFFIPIPEIPGQNIRPILGQGWTLDLEMFFYVVFAIVIFLPIKRKILVLLGIFFVIVLAGFAIQPITDTTDPTNSWAFMASPIILLFALGGGLGGLHRKYLNRQPLPQGFLLAAIVAAVVIGLQPIVGASAPFSLQALAIIWAGSLIAVWCCVSSKPASSNWVSRRMENLGDASYSVYLFHTFFLMLLIKKWPHKYFGAGYIFLYISVGLIVAFGISWPIYKFFERPLNKKLRPLSKLFRGRATLTPLVSGQI